MFVKLPLNQQKALFLDKHFEKYWNKKKNSQNVHHFAKIREFGEIFNKSQKLLRKFVPLPLRMFNPTEIKCMLSSINNALKGELVLQKLSDACFIINVKR